MSKKNYRTVYVMRVDENGKQYQGYLWEVDNLQKYHKMHNDGFVEMVELSKNIVIMCEPEAVVRGLPLNRAVYDENGKFITILAGDIMAVRYENNKFMDIRKQDIFYIDKCLKQIVRIYNGKIITNSVFELPKWDNIK